MIMWMFKKDRQSDFSFRKLEQSPSFYLRAVHDQHNKQVITVLNPYLASYTVIPNNEALRESNKSKRLKSVTR